MHIFNNKYTYVKKSLIVFISILYSNSLCLADTIYLKNKTSLKGIVVKNYTDRIIYSTIDGEKEILKTEISHIKYDEPIDNLINLGDTAFKNGYYRAALKYYLMAQEINPDISSLNNKIYHTETIIYKTPEIQKKKYLALKNEIISGLAPSHPSPEKMGYREKLKKRLGISITRTKNGRFYIDGLSKDSSFKKAGLQQGDIITAIWSNLCTYLTFEDLYNLLANPDENMLTITIERKLMFDNNLPFLSKLVFKWDGLTVEDVPDNCVGKKAGLKKGDIIVAVGKKSIRYTPLKIVLNSLQKRGSNISITIQRKINVFK